MPQKINLKIPPFRKLRGYAFDPSLSLNIDTAFINNIIYKVIWEDPLMPGPSGEYLEIIDYDPTIEKFYTPVDLNEKYILAQDGLDPSESNPQFHQQMVYAVAMTTIKNFESALGRPVLWCPRILDLDANETSSEYKVIDPPNSKKKIRYEYVPQLRIYPHAFRDANAYYSPQKKALLFGYFSSRPVESNIQMPNSQVFTCLSHDIVAHETTHAILDGIYSKYINDTNPDILAFHEAFADIVALFQHFTFPEVLKHQIAKTRGDLASQNLLGQLAQEFGSAIGNYGALRDAIGSIDPISKQWKAKVPNGDEYQIISEPHARGSILVSAVFEAFITIYKSRAADLLRIATGGTGILPQGELHPDLVNRLAMEASKSAGHILKMCIRALDYCPPVDITFGDYLRAIVTSDSVLVADDNRDYRLAFIDAFRKRGIYPKGIKSLSVESLNYPVCNSGNIDYLIDILTKFLREFRSEIIYTTSRQKIFELTRDYIGGRYNSDKKTINGLHRRIGRKFQNSVVFEKITGLAFNENWSSLGIDTSLAYGIPGPSFAIHTLKLAERVGPSGNKSNQIICSLTQHAGIKIIDDNTGGKKVETFIPSDGYIPSPTEFILNGGVTLIFDLDTLKLNYAISKPLIDTNILEYNGKHCINTQRSLELYNYYKNDKLTENSFNSYFSSGKQNFFNETFSFIHSH
jgi:hypothetical protein